mmetsp:Transcript_19991/g.34377  ORF Transcript_19991/g.34377 Transcript_19991/m.34377 type:complete len:247 (+) Transcript_19991:451-1191(+)
MSQRFNEQRNRRKFRNKGLINDGGVMNTDHTARRIRIFLEGGVPSDGSRCAASNGRSPWDGIDGRLVREELIEHGTVEVRFFAHGRLDWELFSSLGHHLVGNLFLCMLLQIIDPAVTHAIRELFLLPPQNVLREIRIFRSVEGLSEDVLLHAARSDHLFGRVDIHTVIDKGLVQEGNTAFDTPGRCCFVGPLAIVQMQLLDLVAGFSVEFFFVRRLVEVEVTAENLVRTLSRENHLDSHGFNAARK